MGEKRGAAFIVTMCCKVCVCVDRSSFLPLSQRSRHSAYPMLPVDHALLLVITQAHTLTTLICPLHTSLIGSVLAQSTVATRPLPPWPASIKDGYAVLASDGPGDRQVLPGATAGDMVGPGVIGKQNVDCSFIWLYIYFVHKELAC